MKSVNEDAQNIFKRIDLINDLFNRLEDRLKSSHPGEIRVGEIGLVRMDGKMKICRIDPDNKALPLMECQSKEKLTLMLKIPELVEAVRLSLNKDFAKITTAVIKVLEKGLEDIG